MSSLTVYAPQITILDNVVDMIDGLYSLNDLHRASGSEKRHKPAFFLRNEQTKEIVTELQISNSPENTLKVKRGGTNQGTWVCKELVYSYAMWISAKFHIAVVRAFDKLVTCELKVKPTNLSNTADRKPLVGAVNIYCAKTGAIFSDIWKMVHQRFNVENVEQMTVEQVPQAIEYVHGFTINCHTKETPLSDFTHSQYITNVKSEVMDYVYLLQRTIVANSINLPKYPAFDKEEVCQAFIVSMIRHNRMMLSFDYEGAPAVSFIPEQHAIVSSQNIAEVVQFADKAQLASIINEAVKRLGK